MSINENRLSEVRATGASVLVGACPTCETNFRLGIGETGDDIEVFDITDLVCHSVGLPTLVMTRFMNLGVM
jgi:Fe-S oxidoreductase